MNGMNQTIILRINTYSTINNEKKNQFSIVITILFKQTQHTAQHIAA